MIQAPAGYGKTHVLAQWRQRLLLSHPKSAWLTLDHEDNSFSQFFSEFVAALQSCGCHISERAIESLRRKRESPSLASTSGLINDLADATEEIFLFIDDFHVINDSSVMNAFHDFVRRAPSNVHVVVASRKMPSFPVIELEIGSRAAVFGLELLRFSFSETKAFARIRAMKQNDFDELQRLFEWSEGWPAGLQLAINAHRKGILWTPGTTETAALIEELSAYFSVAYLDVVTEDVAEFLDKTSVMTRLSAPLIDHVFERTDSADLFRQIEHDGAFLSPLPEENDVYRYHPLFSLILQRRLSQRAGIHIDQLHRRASDWCQRHGHLPSAVAHAIAAGEMERASELLENCALEMVQKGDLRFCLDLLGKLPPTELASRPILKVAKGWSMVLSNRPEEARKAISTIAVDNITAELSENILLIRCLCELFEDNMTACSETVRQWHEESSKQNAFLTAVGCNLLSVSQSHAGEFERARETLIGPKKWTEEERSFYATCYATCLSAYSYVRRGNMKMARRILREEFQRATQKGGRRSAPACTIASFYSEVLYETHEFEALRDLLADRLDVINEVALPEALLVTHLSKARLLHAEGDYAGAQDVLEALQTKAEARSYFHVLAGCLQQRVCHHLYLNDVRTARAISERLAYLIKHDEATARCGSEQIGFVAALAQVRIQIHDEDLTGALQKVVSLLKQLTGKSQLYDVVRLELIRGRLLAGLGHRGDALRLLNEQLIHGERMGLIRVFADEWPSCKRYLESPYKTGIKGISKSYLDRVLRAFDVHPDLPTSELGLNGPQFGKETLIEQLSSREIEVLSLLGQGLQNKQVADVLCVTLDTVKWHLKNSYAKLQVTQRGTAVYKARRLGLI
ncbi:MAG: LuxR C-terminal-related transcriptional regulator [Candidatus Saccharimonadales bacterium]